MKNYQNFSRTLAILLVLAMLLPCVSMTAFSRDIPCAQDGCSGKYRNGICSENAAHFEAAPLEDGAYRISNAGNLYWFAALVNAGGNEYDGDNGQVCNAVLTGDIILNADMRADALLAWTPIGLYTSATEYVRYSGTFDGAGYTIYGLSYDNTAYHGRNAGLFGTVDHNGVVKNLTLADSVIHGATEIGGIAGHNYGTIRNCTMSGTVTGTGATGGIVCRNLAGAVVENCRNTGAVSGATTGGIAAENNGTVTGCDNSGAVTGTNSVGGIVGMNDGTVADSRNTADVTAESIHAGGVVGNLMGGSITGSGNSGAVTGASDYIGGVAGACSGATITACFNTGSVTGNSAKSDAVGGVVGAIDGTNTAKSVITSCYNNGAVSGRSWVGGIAGVSGYQKTPQTVEFANSYNSGTVSGTSRVGAVVGALSKGTVSGSYFLTGVAQNTISGAQAATAAQFASGEITWQLNGSTDQGELVWKQTLATDAFPCFEGAVVHYNSEKGTYYNEVLVENPFVDVPEGSYCFEPVLWAVEKGITTGTSEKHFSPERTCTRAEVVTFLWRAAGSPEPTTTANPFVDVPADSFCAKAVLWAVENGVTNGVDGNHFAPTENCNRAQVVTLLWRAKGSPAPNSTASFTDLVPGEFYVNAVSWAVENGITNGINDTEFGAAQSCTRAQIVTFLYRAYK